MKLPNAKDMAKLAAETVDVMHLVEKERVMVRANIAARIQYAATSGNSSVRLTANECGDALIKQELRELGYQLTGLDSESRYSSRDILISWFTKDVK